MKTLALISKASLLSLPFALLAGCSFLVETSEHQCEETADCEALSGGETSECVDFVCVERGDLAYACQDEPWIDLKVGSFVDVNIQVLKLNGNLPVEGLQLNQCNTLVDPECLNPVSSAVSDSEGNVSISLPEGFRGHLFAPEQDGFMPHLLHMSPPPDASIPITHGGQMLAANSSELNAAAGVVGVAIVPDTATYFFAARDCQGNFIEGVQVSASPVLTETTVMYLSNSNTLDPTLTHTGAGGLGAIVNLPTGNVTIKGVHEDLGLLFEQPVLLQANAITTRPVHPSP